MRSVQNDEDTSKLEGHWLNGPWGLMVKGSVGIKPLGPMALVWQLIPPDQSLNLCSREHLAVRCFEPKLRQLDRNLAQAVHLACFGRPPRQPPDLFHQLWVRQGPDER